MTVPGLLELPNCSSKQQVMRQQVEVSNGDGYFFGPAGRGLGGVQWGAEAAGSSRGVGGGGGGGCSRPESYVQVGFEAIYSWKQHTVLT